MKNCLTLVAMVFCAFCASAQPDGQLSQETSSADVPDRMTLVKNSMQVDQWYEESFWTAYDRYQVKAQAVANDRDARLNTLAHLNENTNPIEAFNGAAKLIMERYRQIVLWQQYFQEITAANNGAIGLKFLQTETLLAMMDEANIYEAAIDEAFRRPVLNKFSMARKARRDAVAEALRISEDKKAIFAETFDKYEIERVDLLGDDYSVYDLYVGDLTDFTPAFSKRLGRDFIEVMLREVKLKEKYLTEVARALDPATAARFIALEDYQSILSKMYLWSTADAEVIAGSN